MKRPERPSGPRRVVLTQLLGFAPEDPIWEADKSGWRCFVMGNHHCTYRKGSRMRAATMRPPAQPTQWVLML